MTTTTTDKVPYLRKYEPGTLLRRKSTDEVGYEYAYDWKIGTEQADHVYFDAAERYSSREFVEPSDIEVIPREPAAQRDDFLGLLSVPTVDDLLPLVKVRYEAARADGKTQAHATVRAVIEPQHVPAELRTNTVGCPFRYGVDISESHIEQWEVRGLKKDSPKRDERREEALRVCKLALPGVRERAVKMAALDFIRRVEHYNKQQRERLIEQAGKSSTYTFEENAEWNEAVAEIEAAEAALKAARQRLRAEKMRQALEDWEAGHKAGKVPDDLLAQATESINADRSFTGRFPFGDD